MRDVTSIKTRHMDGDFVREQSTICFALARKAATPERRAYFLRLAWHWRGIQRALAGREMPRGVVVVRVVAEAAGEPRRVEYERRADHRHAGGEEPFQCDAALPAARGGGLEQRVRGPGAHRLRAAGAEKGSGAAVQDGLRCGDERPQRGPGSGVVRAGVYRRRAR